MKFLPVFALSESLALISARLNERNLDNNRIIGGKEARDGRFPYAVSLSDDIGSFCGGSLISSDVVLTAAHCQGGKNVIVGRHDLSSESGEIIAIQREVPHPDYDDRTTNNDFNLIFLSRPVSRVNLHLVTLNAQQSIPAAGDSVHVMGWGDTDKRDEIQTTSDVLMGVEVKMISNEECAKSSGSVYGFTESYQGQITSSMMCAKDQNEDSCQGDSGGPLVVKGRDSRGSDDVQVGVVSWGVGCAHQSFPGVYARLSTAYDWIREEVCAKSYDPPSTFKCTSSLALEYGGDEGANQSAASKFVSSLHQKRDYRNFETHQWNTLIDEDFSSGYTFFDKGVIGTTLYHSVKGKSGVVRLSNGASIYSKKITDTSSHEIFQVLLSFQFLNMEEDSGICLDYSDDNGAAWTEFACHRKSSTFTNDVWYDMISTELKPAKNINSLTIRLRSSETPGDTLIDRVTIEWLAQ